MFHPNSFARKAHILTLLKSGKPVTVASILESLSKVSLPGGSRLDCVAKTVNRDMKELKQMGCPIQWRRSLDSFELLDMTWDMPATPLLGRDEILVVAAGTQFGSACFPEEVAKKMSRVGAAIFLANTNEFYHGADISTLKILMPPLSQESEGVFRTVYEAWAGRRLLTIQYGDEGGDKTVRTVEPQVLLFHDMTWFIRCYCYLRSAVRTFAVARITHAKLENGTFTLRPELLENITFDTFDSRQTCRNIVIRLTPRGKQIAVANVLHSKQRIVADEIGTYKMFVPLQALQRTVKWILSLCGEAVPISPAELVNEVRETSQRIADRCGQVPL